MKFINLCKFWSAWYFCQVSWL